jgi:hypothetical protein
MTAAIARWARTAAGVVLVGIAGSACSHGGLPGQLTGLRSACDGKKYADAAPYSGPAPHPIAVIPASHGHDFTDAKPEDYGGAVPNKQTAPYQSTNTHRVQLVACAAITHEAKSGPDCKFTDPDGGHRFSVPLHSATYRVTVYELRTHRKVGQATVKTSPGFGYRCPLLLKESDASDRHLDDVDLNQWILALEKYVN